MTDWIRPPTEDGWYWWRKSEKYMPVPVQINKNGPFRNNCFMPGTGWCLKDRIGGEWFPERIRYPHESSS